MRPLLPQNSAVTLIFEAPLELPTLTTDEGKVSQILRDLISNALKFTEPGEVRVAAEIGDRETVTFSVADTGLGISPADQRRIFEEFVQLENPLQKGVKGTGLGLSVCKKLAEFLGGSIEITSSPGVGSTFLSNCRSCMLQMKKTLWKCPLLREMKYRWRAQILPRQRRIQQQKF